ncbi:hypothetical protein [Streptomyces mesophilus]|uniref:hypothetical protein n=1 Tax=Streptomyces mesophilus TaxID=1775132 RepID=UPI00332FB57E
MGDRMHTGSERVGEQKHTGDERAGEQKHTGSERIGERIGEQKHTGSERARTGDDRAHAKGRGLLGRDDRDQWERRLQHAVNGFVDAPRDSVREADKVVEEATARLTELLAERRRSLRTSWSSGPDEGTEPGAPADGATADTEQLRLALRDYRELAERLLGV